jgi:translation initiation factor eIF-2B subunit beta
MREEYNAATEVQAQAPKQIQTFSISKFVLQGQPRKQAASSKASTSRSDIHKDATHSDDPDGFARNMKPVFMEAIQDVLDELETVYENIGKSAKDHIHSESVVTNMAIVLH